jgi:hypothetical protein
MVGPGWPDGRRPSAAARRAQMKQRVAPVSSRAVTRRGPCAVQRGPVSIDLNAGFAPLPRLELGHGRERSHAGVPGRRQAVH